MKNFIFSSLLLLALAGCTSEMLVSSDNDIADNETLLIQSDLLIDSEQLMVDASDASKVAAIFYGKDKDVSRTANSAIIETVNDETSGDPLLHIVNYPGDEGFVIVSGNKYTAPILAYSETGSFAYKDNPGGETMLLGLKNGVKSAADNAGDSLRTAHAFEWAIYEKPRETPKSRAISWEFQQKINKKIEKMEAKGWRYAGNITAATYRLPENEQQGLISQVQSLTDPAYDYQEVTLCFLSDNKENAIGPLLQTQWYKDDLPFNSASKNGDAGCIPLAIAQIAYYHKFPTKFNWSAVPVSPVKGQANSVISELMYEIGVYCLPNYEYADFTYCNIKDASNAFMGLGFRDYDSLKCSKPKMIQAITARNPVYMQGTKSVTQIGHAWVADGYHEKKTTGVVSVVINPNMPLLDRDEDSPYYDLTFIPKVNVDSPTDYFHMNLGYGGKNDGWYHYPGDVAYVLDLIVNQMIITPKKK